LELKMGNLTKITFTGADDSTNVSEMRKISEAYPMTEWGILLPPAASIAGGGKFPTELFLQRIVQTIPDLNLAAHLCYEFTHVIHAGVDPLRKYSIAPGVFKRYQINTHGVYHIPPAAPFYNMIDDNTHTQFIFQLDGINDELYKIASFEKELFNTAALYDISSGTGVSPKEWPSFAEVDTNGRIGFAGGLGPDNILAEIANIEEAVGENDFWVDMETNVRTGKFFDLKKVTDVLQQLDARGRLAIYEQEMLSEAFAD
jgi:hypothetical protein